MTGGLGFTKLAQSLQRTNRNFLKHSDSVKSKKDDLSYSVMPKKFSFKKATPEGFEAIRKSAKVERKKEIIRSISVTAVILSLIVLAILWLW